MDCRVSGLVFYHICPFDLTLCRMTYIKPGYTTNEQLYLLQTCLSLIKCCACKCRFSYLISEREKTDSSQISFSYEQYRFFPSINLSAATKAVSQLFFFSFLFFFFDDDAMKSSQWFARIVVFCSLTVYQVYSLISSLILPLAHHSVCFSLHHAVRIMYQIYILN